jgi:hypothetical protein
VDCGPFGGQLCSSENSLWQETNVSHTQVDLACCTHLGVPAKSTTISHELEANTNRSHAGTQSATSHESRSANLLQLVTRARKI